MKNKNYLINLYKCYKKNKKIPIDSLYVMEYQEGKILLKLEESK